MIRDDAETVAISSLDRHIQEMLRHDISDPAFGIQDVLQCEEDAPECTALVMDLLKFHFGTLYRQDDRLTLAGYFKRFPRHRCWEEHLGVTEQLTQLQIPTHHSPSSANDSRRKGVPAFRTGPLAKLPPRLQHELRSLMQVVEYSPGERVLTEGSIGDRLIVLTAGMIHIMSECPSQTETLLGSAVVGDVLGEMSLMGSGPCTASAVAHGHVKTLVLPADEFHRLRLAHPELAQLITEIVADRLGNEQHDALSFKSLNGYQIQRRLGRGGMSVVYEGIHESTGQPVALKMMSHRLVYDERSRELFDSEARIVASFRHPNIPLIYERFDAFGTSFMAIEFIRGLALTEVISRHRPLEENALLALIGQIACALDHAHCSGVVHRDIKPANCLLSHDGIVKLMDFGLSIQIQEHEKKNRAIMGTLAYMAPEQLAGETPQPPADWFSLGLLAYELATGERLLKPRDARFPTDMYHHWAPGQFLARISSVPLRKFLENCLQLDPASRRVDPNAMIQYATADGINILRSRFA